MITNNFHDHVGGVCEATWPYFAHLLSPLVKCNETDDDVWSSYVVYPKPPDYKLYKGEF